MSCKGIHILFLFFISHLINLSSSCAIFTNSSGCGISSKLEAPLKFRSCYGKACCEVSEEARLQKQFQELNITHPKCASLLKSILCAKCDDQFSAKLFQTASGDRTVPLLCNTTSLAMSQQSSGDGSLDFCTRVWETCESVSVINSPFEPFLQDKAGKNLVFFTSKVRDVWKSRKSFCETYGGYSEDGKVCFHGESISLNNLQTPLLPNGLCLEKIGDGSYLDMAPHPDGSDRAFFANVQGKIWLANIPVEGSNEILEIDESKTFLDISDDILFDSGHGLMGIAFHPNFSQNGRFFVSYNCDEMKNPTCSGRCACNSDVNCDPSKLGPDHGILPCQYHTVVAEFTVNDTSSMPSMAKSANPSEVRRIFTIAIPYSGGHAGQILFGPEDGYLYLMLSDGSSRDDPYNLAQNKRSLLGKILRIDVDNLPSTKEINDTGLWGNYSIPRDNPYVNDKELEPEIWAMGFKNPWRCSFDSLRPSYFLCGDAGQDEYEEIDVVKKGKNYGWRVYEGPFLFHPSESPRGNTSASSIHPIFPILGYSHSEIDKKTGSASIVGGYFYRSTTDPCIYGRYLYTDLYAGYVLVGTESPENSGNFTNAKISSRCAHDSPMPCSFVEGSASPTMGYVYSLAEDNKKDIYYLTSTGVYRVARPSRCNYLCTKEKVVGLQNNMPRSSFPFPLREGFDFLLLFLFLTFNFMV
ncbi:HIPL1 protein-like [Gastrolobium bilobum]|uniref:HIPL1 protein-like n=1 Tax=Gastrolobium bilobum TaxID=150636 RepID=UPI002AB278CD|nr:HIPL1 protein-like [Gastrolobium bilobum]